MKPISALRQFICFGILNGLCGLKYNFADMRFSGPRLKEGVYPISCAKLELALSD